MSGEPDKKSRMGDGRNSVEERKFQYAQASQSDLPCCQLLSTRVERPKLAASVEVREVPLE